MIKFHSAVRRGESDPAFGAEFKFTAHAKELVVGTVYLRFHYLISNILCPNF